MTPDHFTFQRFTVHQDHCAMKVGTDGVLLGAWATGSARILDLGTGTGLIALMMAQRFPHAHITAIDIDGDAARQAADNVADSPFAAQIVVAQGDTRLLDGSFGAIVCNPPFFTASLPSSDKQRQTARHDDTLTYADLTHAAARLMPKGGSLSVITPADQRQRMEAAAALCGMTLRRRCDIRTTPSKPPRRSLLTFTIGSTDISMERTELTIGSAEELMLTKDFYLTKPRQGK